MSKVLSISKCERHAFSKHPVDFIRLVAGLGVEGDAHSGVTVKHRSRVKKDPTVPNLRQVHLLHNELIDELQGRGFDVYPSTLGENITTAGIDLLSLPTDTILRVGEEVEIRITGLRNPCRQLDDYQKGLTAAVLDRDDQGNLIRKAGVMGVVMKGGVVKKDDKIQLELPVSQHRPLKCV